MSRSTKTLAALLLAIYDNGQLAQMVKTRAIFAIPSEPIGGMELWNRFLAAQWTCSPIFAQDPVPLTNKEVLDCFDAPGLPDNQTLLPDDLVNWESQL